MRDAVPYDLIVSGGGPAGAALAGLAARGGLRVALLERRPAVGPKVCGEFLAGHGVGVLKRLGLGGVTAPVPIRRVVLGIRHAAPLDLPLPRPWGRAAPREDLDAALLSWAAAQGADVCMGVRVTGPLQARGRVRGVRFRTREGAGVLEGLRVVAADGRRSPLLQVLAPRRADPPGTLPGTWIGLATHLEGPAGLLGESLRLQCIPGGYFGVLEIRPGLYNLGILVRSRRLREAGGRPEHLAPLLRAALPTALRALHPAGPWRATGPLRFGPRSPVRAAVMFVGDAAGAVDPFCGRGMSLALESAWWCWRSLEAALERGHGPDQPSVARAYARRWRRRIRPVLVTARPLGLLLERSALAGSWARRFPRGASRLGGWAVRVLLGSAPRGEV